jgi:prolipoprotein diacylglyceryltransferase
VLGLEVFVAQAAGAVAMLAAFLEGAGFVARLGHLTGFPEPKMHPAVALAYRLACAIFRFAVSFVRHESLLGGRFPTRALEFAAEQFIYNSV